MVKKVAFFHRNLFLGGAENVSRDTAKYFGKLGIKSYFFTSSWVEEEWQKPCADTELIFLPQKGYWQKAYIQLIIDKINELGIEILFIVDDVPHIPKALKEETACRVYYWLHNTPFWEVDCKKYRKLANLRFYPKRLLAPFIKLYLPSLLQNFEAKTYQTYRNRLEHCDAFLLLCPEYKTILSERLKLTVREQAKCFPIINTIKLQEKPKLEKQKQIIFMGRLDYPHKRVDRLISIWAKIYQELPDWSLKIYGKGADEQQLSQQIKSLNLERISLEGYVADPTPIYQESAILCMTSNYEGVPMVMIEAQNNGVAPIAFNSVRGIDYVLKGEAGIAVQAFDLDAYAKALKNLCLDENLRQRLQENCLRKRLDYSQKSNQSVWNNLLGEDF